MSTTHPSRTAVSIPCCLCGTLIQANAANQCASCLAQSIDLHTLLQRGPQQAPHVTIHQCRNCRRFAQTPTHYIPVDSMEAPELLGLCLKHIPALSSHTPHGHPKLHLVNAGFVWTEPHSMRLKLHLTVRTEVEGTLVQQRVVVEQMIKFQLCPSCNREFTNRTWHALVQVRQYRNGPKSGLVLLEQALAKHPTIRHHVLKVDTTKHGLDFYFLDLPHAQRFSGFLQKVAPMRVKTTQKMVSSDIKNNTANMKTTLACDMVPLTKHDLVLIDKSAHCTLAGRLVLVTHVASTIHMIDAHHHQVGRSTSTSITTATEVSKMELSPETYYRHEKLYSLLLSSPRLTRFVVLDVEFCHATTHGHQNADDSIISYQGPRCAVAKYALANVILVRESDFGVNDESVVTVTHLGHLIRSGDVVLGYDLQQTIVQDLDKSLNASFVVPDVVLVKKIPGDPADHDESGEKPKMTKKQERRIRKKEGKKSRELEDAVMRMGFVDVEGEQQGSTDDDPMDPEMQSELEAMERDFSAMDRQSENTDTEGVGGSNTKDSGDEVDGVLSARAMTELGSAGNPTT